jgi:predicted NBD/HSP70 family sugar kinase
MTKTGMNMERVRQENRALILNCIEAKGPVSRTDIAEMTGLTAASVSQITTALLDEGVLTETGTDRSRSGSVGRRKVLLDIAADAGYCYAVNIESSETAVAIVDRKGRLLRNAVSGDGLPLIRVIPTDASVSPEAFLARVADTCRALSSSLRAEAARRIECCSVGAVGPVDPERGAALHAYGIWDAPVEVARILERELHLPVLCENNVDAFATAEMLFGDGRTKDHLLILKWGPGVGATVVTDGVIYKGTRGRAAELGHLIVDPAGERCSCGRTGCLETMVSADALNRILPFTPGTFASAYEHADEATKRRFDEAVDLFARSIVNAGTILAPDRIILAGNLFRNPTLRSMFIRACAAYDGAYDESRIIYTTLGSYEPYAGPAAVYLKSVLLDA